MNDASEARLLGADTVIPEVPFRTLVDSSNGLGGVGSDGHAELRGRPVKERPWCWAEKAALRRIRDACDQSGLRQDQALAVYLALCEAGSDNKSDTITVTRNFIVGRSGVSLRIVSDVLNLLRRLRLLDWRQNRIEGTRELGPSTYSLLRTPSGADRATSGKPRTTSGTECITPSMPGTGSGEHEKNPPRTVIKESPEECTQKCTEEDPPRGTMTAITEDWLQGVKADPTYTGIEVDRELAKMRNWCRENRKRPSRRRFVNWLNRCDRRVAATSRAQTFTTEKIDPRNL